MKPLTVAFACSYTGAAPVSVESRVYGRRVLRSAVKRICRERGLTDVCVAAFEDHPKATFRAVNPRPMRRDRTRKARRRLDRNTMREVLDLLLGACT